MLVPWRRVRYWQCSACGRCCREYRVPLRFYEYLKLKPTGFVEERRGKFYIRKIGGRCPFQHGNLCLLQGELKPTACKLYPFSIRRKGDELSEFEYGDEVFYVYVDVSTCPNVVLGKAGEGMRRLVEEAVQIYVGERRRMELMTANLYYTRGSKFRYEGASEQKGHHKTAHLGRTDQ